MHNIILNDNLCRCCNSAISPIFTGSLIGHSVEYFECQTCGYVQTEAPYWLDQAYAMAINDSDTGVMARNHANARIVLATMLLLGNLNGTLVDYAGGYGILVRLLRDLGINALWLDPYCQNLLARGFEYTNDKADLVTAFETFEHFISPEVELDRLLAIAPNILFSTEIISNPAPKQSDWWYYGKNHGQHIGFFRLRTLEKLANERGKFFATNGISYHLITEKPINYNIWKIMIRINKLMPLLLQHRLKSKLWADHDSVAKNNHK